MTASTGRQRLARTLGRRGLITALATAGGVYALLLVQQTLYGLVTSIAQFAAFGPQRTIGAGTYALVNVGPDVVAIWGDRVQSSLLTDLPFAIGLFVALWQILPIAPELRFAHVVTRSLFAAGFGAAAVVLVGVVQTIALAATRFSGRDLGRASGEAGHAIGTGFLGSVLHAVSVWVTDVPIVLLAGLLLWGFLQRFPPKHAVTGVADEL